MRFSGGGGVRRRRLPALPAAVLLVLGFAGLILVGTVLLTLPIASADATWTPVVDALFTATSAACVTGLVVRDTATQWSGFGQLVLLVLMQVGGLGFMTGATLLVVIAGRRVGLRNRLLLGEVLGVRTMDTVLHLARRITLFAFTVELLGALVLTVRFAGEYDLPRAAWLGLFHAVSAFTNAGFDLMGGFRSLTPYRQDPVILLTHGALIILGGISYTAVVDVARVRSFARLALDTKLVLVTTLGLLLVGTLGIALTEWGNGATLGSMEAAPALLNALFLSVASRTAGFNAIDIGAMSLSGHLIVIGLMFVGGAAGSTAGGIKVQTFSLLLFTIISATRNMDEVEAFHRRVPNADVLRAIAVTMLSAALIFLGAFALELTDDFRFERHLFEIVSAFGTVGLTTGITPEVSPLGRVILVLVMFAGRLGPLTLALALSSHERHARYSWPQEAVKIG